MEAALNDQMALDHVALRVNDRDATAQELLDRFDVEVIERTDRFTLIGPGEAHGKLTLLDAEDERPTVANRIVSVILAEVPGMTPAPMVLRDGLVVTFASMDELDPDTPRHALVGVSLRASDPPLAAAELEALHGMRVRAVSPELALLDVGDRLADGRITLSRERWSEHENPSILDHIGVRVPDAEQWRERAARTNMDVVRWVEAPHSKALFVAGPEELLFEFVEQTASFART